MTIGAVVQMQNNKSLVKQYDNTDRIGLAVSLGGNLLGMAN